MNLPVSVHSICWSLAGTPEVEVSACNPRKKLPLIVGSIKESMKKFKSQKINAELACLVLLQRWVIPKLTFYFSLRQQAFAEKSKSHVITLWNSFVYFILNYSQRFFFCSFPDRAKVIKGLPDVVAIMEGKVRLCQRTPFVMKSQMFSISNHFCSPLSLYVWHASLMATQLLRSSGFATIEKSLIRLSLPSLRRPSEPPLLSTRSPRKILESTASLCATSMARKLLMWHWVCTRRARSLQQMQWKWVKTANCSNLLLQTEMFYLVWLFSFNRSITK